VRKKFSAGIRKGLVKTKRNVTGEGVRQGKERKVMAKKGSLT